MDLEEQKRLIQGLSELLGEYIQTNMEHPSIPLIHSIKNMLQVVTELSFDYLDKVTEVST